MGTTTKLALPYPEPADPADVPTDIHELADRLDTVISASATSLPGTPFDGQEIYYLADATNGIRWHLRYNAGSSSPYKWECVGGQELFNRIGGRDQAAETSTSANRNAYADLPTVGPDITVPLAGNYFVEIHFAAYLNAGAPAGTLLHMSYAVGATAASDVDAAFAGPAIANTDVVNGYSKRLKTITAAATLVRPKYKVGAVADGPYYHRHLSIRPIRVG